MINAGLKKENALHYAFVKKNDNINFIYYYYHICLYVCVTYAYVQSNYQNSCVMSLGHFKQKRNL